MHTKAATPPLGPAAGSQASELAERRARLAADLRKTGRDALLATREGNVAYLSGYTTATWSNFSRPVLALLHADGRLAMIAAETEADAIRERVAGADVRSYVELRRVDYAPRMPDGRVQFLPHAAEELGELLRDWRVKGLAVDGLDAAFPPVAQVTRLPLGVEVDVTDASSMLWRHRLIKSDWEVQRLRRACEVLGEAFARLESELTVGMTEREIHGALAAEAFRAGADRLGYTNVVAGVDRGLFGAPTDRRWREGEVLYVDGGVIVDGYWADFCRMYVAEEPTRAQAEGYARAVAGLEQAWERVDTVDTVGELARTIAAACDLEPGAVGFGRFGHGIGLYMPEPPSIHPADVTPLDDGLTLCVEPAVEHDGSNFIVEEQCVVRDGRFERISPPAPRELIVIA